MRQFEESVFKEEESQTYRVAPRQRKLWTVFHSAGTVSGELYSGLPIGKSARLSKCKNTRHSDEDRGPEKGSRRREQKQQTAFSVQRGDLCYGQTEESRAGPLSLKEGPSEGSRGPLGGAVGEADQTGQDWTGL